MPWLSQVPTVAQRFVEGNAAGVMAMAQIYKKAVQERLAQGYTTGAFVTGFSADSVFISGPTEVSPSDVPLPASGWGVVVGSRVPYAGMWEYGHFNRFTNRYERVPVWITELYLNQAAMLEAYTNIVNRALGNEWGTL